MVKIKLGKPRPSTVILLILGLVWFMLSLLYCTELGVTISDTKVVIYLLSVAGVVQFFITIKNIKDLQGQLLSPYFFFYCFLFAFNYGQFAMWAFGIHYKGEITVTSFIRHIDDVTAVKMQIISLELLVAVHMGALLSTRFARNSRTEQSINRDGKAFRIIAIPLLVISGLITFVYTIIGFRHALVMGYSAYFTEALMPPMLKYISYMFIPSIFLTLTAYNCSKRAFRVLTLVFIIYDLPLFLTGDRGSWIYFIVLWIWAYIAVVSKQGPLNSIEDIKETKKRNKRTVVGLVLLAIVVYFGSLFFSVRDLGFSNISSVKFDYSDLFQPFIRPFFEMGQSSVLLGVVIQDNMHQTWRFGNTYISEILGMALPRISTLFGYQDFYLENWFSEYLRMGNYGVGFSAFAEAVLNGGIFFSWFYMMLYGFFVGWNSILIKGFNEKDPRLLFVSLASTIVLIPTTRNSMQLYLREYFWGIVLVLIIVNVITSTRKRNTGGLNTI